MKPLSTTSAPPFRLTTVRQVLTVALLTALVYAAGAVQAMAVVTVIDDFTEVHSPSPWLAASPNNYNGLDGLDLTTDLSFANPIPPNPDGVTFPKAYDESGLNTSHVLGGTRRSELSVTASSPPQPEFEIAMINVLPGGGGTFNFESGLTVIAHTSLIYNAALPVGAASGTAFVRFNSYDQETDSPLLVRLALDDGLGGTGQIDRTLGFVIDPNAGDPPFDLALPLGEGEFGGVNFAVPLTLTFTLFGNMADDFELEHIVLQTEDTPTVPEPSTWAMGLAGLLGLVGYGMQRMRKRSIRKKGPTMRNLGRPHLKNLFLGCCAAALVVLVQGQASALVIDTFDDNPAPALNLTVTTGDGPGTNIQNSPVAGTVSNNRTATLTVISGDTDSQATMRIIGALPNRRLSLSSEDSVIAKWNLDYVPLSSIDVTDGGTGTGIQVHFLSADNAATVTVSLDVPGAGSPLTQTLVKGIGPEVLIFDFNAFVNSFAVITPVTAATLVNGIHFEVLGNTSGDYSIELIDTYVENVPEPSTLVLAGLGMVGLAFWGWQRRSRTNR